MQEIQRDVGEGGNAMEVWYCIKDTERNVRWEGDMKDMVRNGGGGGLKEVHGRSGSVLQYTDPKIRIRIKVQDPEKCFQQTISFLKRATFLYE
jgi:hypothetical protein